MPAYLTRGEEKGTIVGTPYGGRMSYGGRVGGGRYLWGGELNGNSQRPITKETIGPAQILKLKSRGNT